jgi:hypothetical protein
MAHKSEVLAAALFTRKAATSRHPPNLLISDDLNLATHTLR